MGLEPAFLDQGPLPVTLRVRLWNRWMSDNAIAEMFQQTSRSSRRQSRYNIFNILIGETAETVLRTTMAYTPYYYDDKEGQWHQRQEERSLFRRVGTLHILSYSICSCSIPCRLNFSNLRRMRRRKFEPKSRLLLSRPSKRYRSKSFSIRGQDTYYLLTWRIQLPSNSAVMVVKADPRCCCPPHSIHFISLGHARWISRFTKKEKDIWEYYPGVIRTRVRWTDK